MKGWSSGSAPAFSGCQINLAISRLHIGAASWWADEGKSTSAATSQTENGECQAGAPNQDRFCSKMCLGHCASFPAPPARPGKGVWGRVGGISLYDGSRAWRAKKPGPFFRQLSLFLGFNMAGVSHAWRGEAQQSGNRGGGGRRGGTNCKDKQTQEETQHAREQKN